MVNVKYMISFCILLCLSSFCYALDITDTNFENNNLGYGLFVHNATNIYNFSVVDDHYYIETNSSSFVNISIYNLNNNKGELKINNNGSSIIYLNNLSILSPYTIYKNNTLLLNNYNDSLFKINQTSNYSFINNYNQYLVLYVNSDKDSLTNTYDFSKNNYNGTLNNGVLYNNSGYISKSFSFDGNNDYISFSSDQNIYKNFASNEMTISAFVKVADFTTVNNIVYNVAGGSGLYPRLNILTDGDIQFQARINGATQSVVTNSNPLSINNWYHIVSTYSNKTGNMSIYVNSNLIYSEIKTKGVITSNANVLRIGNDENGGTFFNGSIDELLIYNKSLPLEEIQAIYNNQSNRSSIFTTEKTFDVTSSSGRFNLSVANYQRGIFDEDVLYSLCSGDSCTDYQSITNTTGDDNVSLDSVLYGTETSITSVKIRLAPSSTGFYPAIWLTDEYLFTSFYEVCTDGIDNDGNGLIDCNDPVCIGGEYCGLTNGAAQAGIISTRTTVFSGLAILTIIIIVIVGFALVNAFQSGDSATILAVSIASLILAIIIILAYYILGTVSSALI